MNNRRWFLSRSALFGALHASVWTGCESVQAELAVVAPVRFKQLVLRTKPLEAMRVFYGETMGFPIEQQSPNSFVMVAGDSTIQFQRTESPGEPFYHFAFSIAENKIEAAKAWTERRTTVLTQSSTGRQIIQFGSWNADAIYFLDPAGNIGEFIAHHSLATASEGDFSLQDVLYTSEIGLVVDDVRRAVREIEPLIGFSGSRGVSKNFAAVGDARGYLIVVPKQRIWLPTNDVKAEPHEVRARLQSQTTGTHKLDSGPFTINLAKD